MSSHSVAQVYIHVYICTQMYVCWDMADCSICVLLMYVCSTSRRVNDTPLPTPTYKYNTWAEDRKSFGITPKPSEGKEGDDDVSFQNDFERAEWEEEQKVSTKAAECKSWAGICVYEIPCPLTA